MHIEDHQHIEEEVSLSHPPSLGSQKDANMPVKMLTSWPQTAGISASSTEKPSEPTAKLSADSSDAETCATCANTQPLRFQSRLTSCTKRRHTLTAKDLTKLELD